MIEKNLGDVVQAIDSLRHTVEGTNRRLDTIAAELNRYKELSFAENLQHQLNLKSYELAKRLEVIAEILQQQQDS